VIFSLLFHLIYGEKNTNTDCSKFCDTKDNTKNDLPNGFTLVDEKIPNGPITVDRKKDDGTKRNIFKMARHEDDNFYYNYEDFNKLNSTTPIKEEYFCELKSKNRPETLKGYDISCPFQYTIKIDKSFFGRYGGDRNHCIEGNDFFNETINIEKSCGYDPIMYVQKLCEGRNYCNIVPTKHFFSNYCKEVPKYLNIKYHCVKNNEIKKEKFSIVAFYEGVNVNTLSEHSISEFYQYAKLHNYEFQLYNMNYAPGRQIFFMKLYSVIEKMIEGLKSKKYDWIFWVDSDVIILNPNIKLEAFLPNDNMSNIHIISAIDYLGKKQYCCGLNAGIFFIRVHEWSLNLLMRAISYPYFNKEKDIHHSDQTSLNNVLIESNETEHYVIVPQQWFNNRHIKKGDFLFHIMGFGSKNKNETFKKFLNETKNDEGWYSKTNEEMRKEVLKYYELPKEQQLSIKIQP
jgi:hypothetical protein